MFRSRAALELENMALRHQIGVRRSAGERPKLTSADRLFPLAALVRLALGVGYREASDCDRLASQESSLLLDQEDPTTGWVGPRLPARSAIRSAG
jgi:hypothetical protein